MTSPRILRERKTLRYMVEIYCSHHHPGSPLCQECQEILSYANARLDHCPFQETKGSCNKCPKHCYRNDMKGKIKSIMRYSGRKMLWHHPILALLHIYDALKGSFSQR